MNYTLNQFYFETQALIEKYKVKADPSFPPNSLNCSFEIKDKGTGPVLQFLIILRKEPYGEAIATAFGGSAKSCLGDFEIQLMKATGRTISANNYSVNTDDADQSTLLE